MELTLRHLAALSAIDEEGSIGRAAARLGMSQPALTAQLHRIERELGEVVFERSRTGVVATRTGRRVLVHARAALTSVTRLREEVQSLPTGARVIRLGGHGPLVVALTERLSATVAPDLTVAARAEKSSHVLDQELVQGKLDFALLRQHPGHEVPLGAGADEQVVVEREPVFVGFSRGHDLASREVVDLADLRDESWVIDPDDDTGETELLREACLRAGFEPRPGLITGDNGVARSFIGSGRAVALFEARAAQDDTLVVRPLRGDPIYIRLVLRWRRGAELAVEPGVVTGALEALYEEVATRHPVYRRWRERRGLTGDDTGRVERTARGPGQG
ncbi:MAG: LysR family transcriptional regulator [Dermatophilaceae bacterium]